MYFEEGKENEKREGYVYSGRTRAERNFSVRWWGGSCTVVTAPNVIMLAPTPLPFFFFFFVAFEK
jgi:hypothetical protein